MNATETNVPRHLVVSAGTGLDTGEEVTINRQLTTPLERLRAWADLMVVDHGLLRVVWPNSAIVAPGVFRSSQPAPYQLARWRERGVRTVFNLRAERNCGSFVLEEAAASELGLRLINLQTRSRDVPSKDLIATADRLFAEVEYPILLHCKSGADRAGIMSALYLLLRENASAAEAIDQLNLRFGHIRQAKTGMLDYFLDAFAKAERDLGIGFRDWVANHYDPGAMKAAFMARWKGTLGVDLAFWRE